MAQSPRSPGDRRPGAPQIEPVRRKWSTSLIIGGFTVLVVIFIVIAQIQNRVASVGIGDPVSADVLNKVTKVSPTVAATIGEGATLRVLQATPKSTTLLLVNGKPEVIYIGAEWCPYCAATRWSMVVALSRFGSFNGLTLMKSSGSDVYPNTSTVSFRGATYTSAYISFNATETADRDQNRLDTPTGAAAHAFALYDAPPYTTTANGIPFMSFGDRYVMTSSMFLPTALQGLTWQQIAAQLNNPKSDVAKAIIGGANQQTAAICALTKNQPGDVCNAPYIQQLEAGLPQPKS